MNKILSASVVVILLACNSADKKAGEKETFESGPTATPITTLEPFADSLVRLDKYQIANIDRAAYYFQKLVPADSVLADSASVLFLNFSLSAVDSMNQKLWQDTVDYSSLVYGGGSPPTQGQKAFQHSLKQAHINLQGNGEGDVLAVLDYDWFNAIVQKKTSAVADAYLNLLGAEEKEPALLDAGLAVELDELIRRLLVSETLADKKLPARFHEDLAVKNKFYTNILLLGSDNTPSLEYEKEMVLTPEFKKAYDQLLATHPDSKAAQQVRDWLNVLKAKDRKSVARMKEEQWQ